LERANGPLHLRGDDNVDVICHSFPAPTLV